MKQAIFRIIFLIIGMLFLIHHPSLLEAHNWQKDQVVLFANIEVLEDRITMGLSIPGPLANDLLTQSIRFDQAFTVDQQLRIKADILSYLEKENPIIADGQRLMPKINELMLILTAAMEVVENPALKVSGVSMHSGIEGACMVLIEYPMPKTTRQIQFQWTSKTLWMSMGKQIASNKMNNTAGSSKIMPAVLVDGDALQPFRLTIQEPEFVWHRPAQSNTQKPQITQSPKAVPIPFKIPIVSIAIFVVMIFLLGFKASFRKWPFILISFILIPSFWFYRPIALKDFESKPSDEVLVEVFKTLHQGIYQAFQAKGESEIYDHLAQNISGELLDQIYQSTYQGLILKEEGNAKSMIKDLKYIDIRIDHDLQKKSPHRSAIHVIWQIFGEVNHWGHQHHRVNQYEASYEIEHQIDGWKIVAVHLIEQKRKPELEKKEMPYAP